MDVREFYDQEAETYDKERSAPYFLHLRKAEMRFMKFLEEPILDLGSGTGSALHGREAVAVDISREMLKRNPFPKIQADVQSLPFPDSSFPSATGLFISLAFTDIHKSLTEIRRVLKPKGRLLISLPILPGKTYFRHKGVKIRFSRVPPDFQPPGFRILKKRFVFGRLKPKWRNYSASFIDSILMLSESIIPPRWGDVCVFLLESTK